LSTTTTVKLDNTLEHEWQTDIYLADVPCSGTKKELPLYFAAVTLLIILTGMAQIENLSKWLPHRKEVASKTKLRSWRCNNKKKFLHDIAYLFCSLALSSCKTDKEKRRERGI
jgi:hypothetical protein